MRGAHSATKTEHKKMSVFDYCLSANKWALEASTRCVTKKFEPTYVLEALDLAQCDIDTARAKLLALAKGEKA